MPSQHHHSTKRQAALRRQPRLGGLLGFYVVLSLGVKPDTVLFDTIKNSSNYKVYNIGDSLKIGRIAVLKEYRGKHYGATVVNAVVAKSIEAGAERIYVDAQNHAVNFYEKLGFRICGRELVDRGIVHTPMCIDKGDFNVEE